MTGQTAPGDLLPPLLRQLADVVEHSADVPADAPTPCAEFTVAQLRDHVVEWSGRFAASLAASVDQHGDGAPASTDSADAATPADAVRASADTAQAALAAGAAEQQVVLTGPEMPAGMLLTLGLWEFTVHGHDLAVAVGRPWDADDDAVEAALPFAHQMLSDEYRGPGKDFGPEVPVDPGAPPLDRLLGFSGRDPSWSPPAP